MCTDTSQQWMQNLFPWTSSFSAVRDKSSFLWEILSLQLLGCGTRLQILQQGAGRALCPLGHEDKRAVMVSAVEKVHISCCLLLDFKGVLMIKSKSMSFFSHTLEWCSSKVKSSFYSAMLDKVGFFKCGLGVQPTAHNTQGVLDYHRQWTKPDAVFLVLLFVFSCAVNDWKWWNKVLLIWN